MIRRLDDPDLVSRYQTAKPFPHIVLDDFVAPDRAQALASALPAFGDALAVGTSFDSPYEKLKVQVTDPAHFAPPVRALHERLSSPEFLAELSELTGIPDLLADPELSGGGIHETDSGGRLDVHVDFNFMPQRQWWRRLNLLLYLNDGWQRDWGGILELWNEDVSRCEVEVVPELNRCVIFTTGDYSYHGVTAVSSPPGRPRKSFSAYYYTATPPPGWRDEFHGTLFKARPGEAHRDFDGHTR
jgi:hypothetical protein